MKKTIEICTCDICKKEQPQILTINYPVLFTTEQTEGRGVTPYISQEKLDVCQECITKLVRLQGHGAMGNNTYILI
jgi:hypothetical protein